MVTHAAVLAAILLWFDCAGAQKENRPAQSRSAADLRPTDRETELSLARDDVIQKIRETRAGAEKLLALREAERQRLLGEYQTRAELYHRGLIARAELVQVEDALARATLRIDEDMRWLRETDMAITEVILRDELLRLPPLAPGGYSETGAVLRFDGAARWALDKVPTIEKFFVATFGRVLPISALGQTPTHDRLRFDHRDGVDVALHPDSKEGRSLLSYLRQAGIPFVAFRGSIPGASTGAHIHIGKPSPRR
jgi:hypothetical protein